MWGGEVRGWVSRCTSMHINQKMILGVVPQAPFPLLFWTVSFFSLKVTKQSRLLVRNPAPPHARVIYQHHHTWL